MVRHRLAGLTAGCLLSLAGLVQGEPVADQPAAPDRAAAGEVWGDPEEAEGAGAPGWTWFGMGYERRNRDRMPNTMPTPEKGGAAAGNGRSGR